MSTDEIPEDQITEPGAVELDDVQLDEAAGAAGVIAIAPASKPTDGQPVFADGSVRFLKAGIG